MSSISSLSSLNARLNPSETEYVMQVQLTSAETREELNSRNKRGLGLHGSQTSVCGKHRIRLVAMLPADAAWREYPRPFVTAERTK